MKITKLTNEQVEVQFPGAIEAHRLHLRNQFAEFEDEFEEIFGFSKETFDFEDFFGRLTYYVDDNGLMSKSFDPLDPYIDFTREEIRWFPETKEWAV